MGMLFFNTTWFELEENPDVQAGKEWGDQKYREQCELPLDTGGLKQPLVSPSLCEMQLELSLFEVR